MNVARIEVDYATAAELYRKYNENRDVATEQDRKIESVYRQIMRGKKVIRAIESIRQAGLDEKGRPKLALIRADAKECYWRGWSDEMVFRMDRWSSDSWSRRQIKIPWKGQKWGDSAKAIVPLIPVHLRPKTALSNYHVLWEADWQDAPIDPMLLRRMGADLWIVLAAWDLTSVERAVLGDS